MNDKYDELPFSDHTSMDPDRIPDEPGICDLCEGCIELCRYQPFPNEYGFHKLIDAMIREIIDLEEEIVRCREALIHHLPKQLADGLYDDIFCNLSARFTGNYEAYDDYINALYVGDDPMESKKHFERMLRLRDGKDETTYYHLH